MPTSINTRFGIRQRLLLLTLFPLLFISLVLGAYFTMTRLQDAENILVERGQLLARLVASSSEFALMTGNNELLKSISKGPFQEKDVADVLFLNGEYQLIQRSAQFPISLKVAAPSAYIHDQYWYFTQPVSTTGIPFLDNPEFQETESISDTVGWVIVIMSESRKEKQEQQILLASISLLLLAFVSSAVLALRFGKRISQPILGLTQVMERIQTGSLDTRVTNTYTGEFNLLAQGLNGLADTIQKLVTNQENRINLATRKLQATLHHLEQQNTALAKASKRADEANKAKDEFLARMSHELRTPLTSVVGFAKLMKQSPCSPEQLEHIRIINQTSLMLLSIIDDILDFSKLQQDAITLELIDFNLEEIIYDVLEMQAPKAHEKGLELITHMQPRQDLDVIGDPTRLRQIISNLIANAVKFTQSGTVEVHVDISPINNQQSLYTLKVIDTGIGIPQEHLEQLFQAFMQADTSITRRFGGSGLGLVISKKLTELMGGRLEMISEEGEGTTVSLYLPFKPSENRPLIKVEPPTYNNEQNIVICEGNVSQRRSLIEILFRQTERVINVRSIDECLQHLAPHNTFMVGLPAKATSEEERIFHASLSLLSSQGNLVVAMLPSDCQLPIEHPTNLIPISKPARPDALFKALNLPYYLLQTGQENNENLLPISVVLAEDNEFNRLLISKILEKSGINVFPAATGVEAIEQTQAQQPDLVIMDVHMPVMDGLEATSHIKQKYPDLPVIALTANIIAHEHHALISAGISKVLLKPVNDDELISTIRYLTVGNTTNSISQSPHSKQEKVTNIEDYDVSTSQIEEELGRLCQQIHDSFTARNTQIIGEVNHQLIGLAGLYELPEIECCASEIHNILHTAPVNWKELWYAIWQLKRVLKSVDNTDG
ncbi:ATP-binding protein [Neptunomonas phycophila]|uniref:ATP-binding protein n=1 Tax=Neptunomonas phycophila TaxID=1572645 RepID=UPI0030FB00C4